MNAQLPPRSEASSLPLAEKPHAPLWLLALVVLSGTLGMHIFVPALPVAAADLGAGVTEMQLTITLYVVGLALGQLVYGPVSDRVGRRPTMLAGIALYTVAGLGAALARDAQLLIAARLLQALGGCAGMVLGRAIIRDLAGPLDAARRLATLNLIVTLGPGIAPAIGALLVGAAGWRALLFAVAGLGLVNLALCLRLLPETRPADSAPDGFASLMRNYRGLLGSRVFIGYALGGGCATTAMYGFVAAAPFIFVHQLGRPVVEVGPYLAFPVLGFWAGSIVASRLLGRFSLRRLTVLPSLLSLAAGWILLVGVALGQISVPLVIACAFAYSMGAGIAAPGALTQALGTNTRIIGTASGFYGFTQMAVGALCTALTSFGDNPALAAALVLAGAGVVAQLSFWLAGRGARA